MALKDNVCLAGVPMMNGASTLKGYTPDIDATIVTRLLDAGATITGKAHCEYFCLSGGSHTNATGAVHNPHKHGYSAGGSSSGSGALVGAGLVEFLVFAGEVGDEGLGFDVSGFEEGAGGVDGVAGVAAEGGELAGGVFGGDVAGEGGGAGFGEGGEG